jgi:diaminohydroxyphosphoribosylaminopyrimidine deaminase/5-amino-6-(5-phosphoribosylamino)uracil reductase
MDTKDEKYHLRTLQLALNGLGRVAPNPMVGSVIVLDDKIIGEGYHQEFGGPHAEVNAIASVKDESLLRKATLYVNLEPCAHYGKTPPCAELIIKKQIPNIVIGQLDPFPAVSGKGMQMLLNAGINAIVGNHVEQCRFINRRFLTFHEQKRPFYILKWAQTIDGYIDIARTTDTPQAPTWITDEHTRILVHKWRSEEQAILIGTNTALFDNPRLNTRDFYGKNPIRLVLDRQLRLPNSLHVFDKSVKTFVFTEKQKKDEENLEYIQIDFSKLLEELSAFCYEKQIQSVIVEGGARLLNTFIQQNLWNEARVFVGNTSFGKGIAAPSMNSMPASIENLPNSMLKIWHRTPSAFTFGK